MSDYFTTNSLTFTCLLLFGAMVFHIYLLAKKVSIWRAARRVSGSIIGYQFQKRSLFGFFRNPTGFHPVVKSDSSDEDIVVKDCRILIPEGKCVSFRLTEHNRYISPDFYVSIFVVALLGIVLCIALSPNFISGHISLLYFSFFFALMIFCLGACLQLLYQRRTLGTLQEPFGFIWPKKLKNLTPLSKHELQKLEKQRLVSYQDAMSHYYTLNKNLEKWVYLILGIIASIILWKFFLNP